MTDFLGNLLTEMSSTFNQPDGIEIDLNEDKTLKWRGLHHNQYAANKRRTRRSGKLESDDASDSDSNSNNEEIINKIENEDNQVDSKGDVTNTLEKGVTSPIGEMAPPPVDDKKIRCKNKFVVNKSERVLRRKTSEIQDEKPKIITSDNDISDITDVKYEVPFDDEEEKQKKLLTKRATKKKKNNDQITESKQIVSDTENSIISSDSSSPKRTRRRLQETETTPKINTIVDTAKETKKELSKTTLHVKRKDRKQNLNLSEIISPSDEVKVETPVCEKPKRKRKDQNTDMLTEPESEPEATGQEVKFETSSVHENVEDKKPRLLMTIRADKSNLSIVPDQTLNLKNKEKVLKKRGRKPGTIVKKSNKFSARSSPLKKSLRLSKDTSNTESVLANAIARKEKSFEKVAPQQRLSRRIKPTPKILANDELRHGFEIQNNARLSLSSENLDNETDNKEVQMTSPSGRDYQQNKDVKKPENKEEKAIVMVLSKGKRASTDDNKDIILTETNAKRLLFPKEDTIVTEQLTVDNIYTMRKPCPEPEEFLNDIKSAKIGLHRSPEDNKKLNKKQQRRLTKLKEKHFQMLGLKKTRSAESNTDSDDNSDENEEFVPTKKINVGKPGVTLRIRTQPKQLDVMKEKRKIDETCEKRSTRNTRSLLLSNRKRQSSLFEHFSEEQSHSLTRSKIRESVNSSSNQDDTICLCSKKSDIYSKRSAEIEYCGAVDQIESQKIGCCNEVDDDNLNLQRPSVRVSFMALCESHKKRFIAHNCCAGCGIFCTQGMFLLCARNHFFHKGCALKFIMNTPYELNNRTLEYSSPTLVLKCPHCGIDAPTKESQILMKCQNNPVFFPSQRHYLKPAKMSMSGNKEQAPKNGKENIFLIDIERLIPESIVDIVVKAQREVSMADDENFTSRDFFYAVNNDDIQRVAEIIASGFDISVPFREFHHGSCLHLISHFGSLNMTYLILCRISSIDFLNLMDKELRTAVMCAVVSMKHEILKLLVQCGADVTLKGPNGMTALHLAAKIGNLTAAQIILEYYRRKATISKLEAFINSLDDGNWTALVWAAELGYSEIVSLLINLGADVGICDTENNTVLHWAALSNKIETILPLLQPNCNFNLQNINGDTPLHIACRNSNTRICLIFLAHGASLNVKNHNNETPFDCIPDEGICARTIQFNLQLRQMASFPERRILVHDLSNGRENYPIQMVQLSRSCSQDDNDFLDSLPDFKYITNTILLQTSIQIDRRISQMRICTCSDNCTSDSCQCCEISSQNWYTLEGRLNNDFNYQDPAMIFECNDVCGCNKMLCKNRVVQNGTRVPLQVFECEEKIKGWGVKSLKKICKGTFVAEYTGEILTDNEADRRTDDSYFFDLGASEHCIDANFYGNVSRFFNHSCDSNIVPIRVYFEHQDLRFPKIAFFALRDIAAGEEITFDYGEKFWMIKHKYFTCHCLTPHCRYSSATISKTLEEFNQRNSTNTNVS